MLDTFIVQVSRQITIRIRSVQSASRQQWQKHQSGSSGSCCCHLPPHSGLWRTRQCEFLVALRQCCSYHYNLPPAKQLQAGSFLQSFPVTNQFKDLWIPWSAKANTHSPRQKSDLMFLYSNQGIDNFPSKFCRERLVPCSTFNVLERVTVPPEPPATAILTMMLFN